jgi:phosphoglycerate dehydrogenase-like enzyme
MTRAAFFCNAPAQLDQVYAAGRRQRLEELVDLYGSVVTQDNFAAHREHLRDTEVVFSTWGMPVLGSAELDWLPSLRAVFYAAGSVRVFAPPLLERGITVVSAWGANAVPVAEFALAQILLSCKGCFRNVRDCRDARRRAANQAFRGRGVFGETIGLIGLGMVASYLCELLRPYHLHVIGHDPYLGADRAAALGVELVGLDELFRRAYVISNHLPNLPATRGMLDRRLLETMRQDATFINTGRGAQVVEADLVAVLRERPDLTALLDVTDPEPPVAGSPLYDLPNVQLTSHIAGSMNDEVVRMADYAIAEYERWERGEPLRYAVTLEMLETMA